MQPDLNSFFRDPDPIPRRVEVEWSDELVTVKVGKYTLGIEPTLEILRAVIDAIEFNTEAQMGNVERDQATDGLTRICLEMEGR